ncbi:MAG: SDR family NAD(P)-dependent oxidoreductase, partial [Candidatus Sericytochromatia bacterium]|nr:SDR family NAD(P)-dependent oxidoreductase [Candidatus Sericytochromatia bacterium]
QQGLRVIVGSRHAADGEAVAGRLRTAGHQAQGIEIDVARPESVAAAIETLHQLGTHVDVLINNAGVYPHGTVLDTPMDVMGDAYEIHVFSPMALIRACVPAMIAAGYGRVVNVSSGLGQMSDGLGGAAPYSMTKAALNALTLQTANETKGNIKVNAVCPGWVQTRMGGEGAPRSVDQGAASVIWAAVLPDDGPTGGFYRDGQQIAW